MTLTLTRQPASMDLFLQRVPSVVKLSSTLPLKLVNRQIVTPSLLQKPEKKPILLRLWYEYKLGDP